MKLIELSISVVDATVGFPIVGSLFSIMKSDCRNIKNKVVDKLNSIEKEEKEQAIAQYWENHADEKKKLEDERTENNIKMEELESKIAAIEEKNSSEINRLTKEKDKKLDSEIEVEKQKDIIKDLEKQRASCGLFKFRKRKEINEKIYNVEQPKLDSIKKKAEEEKKAHTEKYNKQIWALQDEVVELRAEVSKLKQRNDEIKLELTKSR